MSLTLLLEVWLRLGRYSRVLSLEEILPWMTFAAVELGHFLHVLLQLSPIMHCSPIIVTMKGGDVPKSTFGLPVQEITSDCYEGKQNQPNN